MELNEQEIIRRQSLSEIMALGIDPFPAELWDINASAAEINENYENNKIEYKNVSMAVMMEDRWVKK